MKEEKLRDKKGAELKERRSQVLRTEGERMHVDQDDHSNLIKKWQKKDRWKVSYDTSTESTGTPFS